MNKPKVGLLPLYLELYDRSMPEIRAKVEKFYKTIAAELGNRGLEVVTAPVCRLRTEFKAAISLFEKAQVEAIVTLHLAYSPSRESSKVLAATELSLIVLDTTPAYSFGPGQNPDEIMYNHGIHGVQDMCNLLIRNGKSFQIEAGHWQKSDVLNRVVCDARAAQLASNMRKARVGLIGEPFRGMGDFAVPPDTLRQTIGVETVKGDSSTIRSLLSETNDREVEKEMVDNVEKCVAENLDTEAHRRTVQVCLAIRRWIEKERLSAFTVNFLQVDKSLGLPTVPFLEASKAMARGIGYAGEGDILTAALVGVLASTYPETTFTEMFCSDWENESIFLSHMGEMNINLADSKPKLVEKPFPWTDADNPVVAVGRFRSGEAVLINLAPGPEDTYTLIIAPVEMIEVKEKDRMAETVHGWFKPKMSIAEFLTKYSYLGGTHHLALVYGNVTKEIKVFGKFMEWETIVLDNAKLHLKLQQIGGQKIRF